MSADLCPDGNPICPLPYQFKSLLYNTLFSDFTIHVHNAPTEKLRHIPTHRFLLDSFSGYFHQLFNDMPNEKSLSVYFPDWATPGIYAILEFIYKGGKMKFTNENIGPITYIVFIWEISSLQDECLNELNNFTDPFQSLTILSHISSLIPEKSAAEQKLIENVALNLSLFDKTQCEDLSFQLFEKISSYAYDHLSKNDTYCALCEAIEHYFQKNIVRLGSHEFNQMIRIFSMKSGHSGIISLYKIGLTYGWNIKNCESKILHAWERLDQDKLSKLPIDSLQRLLHENYLNTKSEDNLVDFIFLVHKNQPEEDITCLFKELRFRLLSKESKEKIKQSKIEIPYEILNGQIPNRITGRLPRSRIKCLILGACDDSALADLKHMLNSSWIKDSHIVTQRADTPYDIDFTQFHTIFVFGFYKFWNPEKSTVSQLLYQYHCAGGGLIIAYGAHRADSYGIGEPLKSALPIEYETSNEIMNSASLNDKKKRYSGCKHMRVKSLKARADGIVESYWNDGVPFLIKKHETGQNGAIYVLNATPCSVEVISDQWEGNDNSIIRLFGNVVVSSANYITLPNKKCNE
ncbi:hypothetical protein TRFO_39873 [Tritrichomonas foetus]|uniref:BTB domain-containing protein n=1 Tax=Tritrichomonas foetus TaxID=1144522 RepID=A0A1J4J3E2_9EUKA|nr:hypothetical protein TRFO_39873 [Tritrichomonas foetus]|eukprot:OHS93942.1 hypothetical protein TRFO_39873 [Tritrichomonas foetus]